MRSVFEWPYSLQQEWAFIDSDTGEHRAIDICTEIFLYDLVTIRRIRVRPRLTLMIECKQSNLPYVFFLLPDTPDKVRARNFPVFAGLSQDIISIHEESVNRKIAVDLLDALGLDRHKFIDKCPAFSMSFAKCLRKGKELELSGSEPFHALVMPLLKAVRHYQLAQAPKPTARYFDCHLIIGIAVVDATMVGGEVSKTDNHLSLLPWVRIIRHLVGENLDLFGRTTLFALDVVHKDFFEVYLRKHLFPFANDFSDLVFKHQEILASGKAFLEKGRRVGVTEIEPGLRPVLAESDTTP